MEYYSLFESITCSCGVVIKKLGANIGGHGDLNIGIEYPVSENKANVCTKLRNASNSKKCNFFSSVRISLLASTLRLDFCLHGRFLGDALVRTLNLRICHLRTSYLLTL